MTEDRGLQPERTSLAWTRTALAGSTSAVALLLRDRDVAELLHSPARLCVAGVAAVIASAAFGTGLWRRRELATTPPPSAARARRHITSVGVSVVLLSVLVLILLLTRR
jgi:uncharacterized membrane protein YidH (DUF202 family)